MTALLLRMIGVGAAPSRPDGAPSTSDRFRRPGRAGLIALTVLGAICLGGRPASIAANDLKAAGDRDHLWLAMPVDDGRTTLLYRRVTDPATLIQRVTTVTGRLQPSGAAGAGDQLWLIYENNAVQSVRVRPETERRRGGFDRPWIEPPLAVGLRLRSLAAGAHRLWALVHADDAQALARLSAATSQAQAGPDAQLQPAAQARGDDQSTPAPSEGAIPEVDGEADAGEVDRPGAQPGDDSVNVTDPALDPSPVDGAEDPAAASVGVLAPAASSNQAGPNVRSEALLELSDGRWRRLALPASWPGDVPTWLMASHRLASRPILVALADPQSMWVYEPTAGSREQAGDGESERDGEGQAAEAGDGDGPNWRRAVYEAPPAESAAGARLVAVEGLLVIGWGDDQADRLRVRLHLLRQGDQIPMGEVELDLPGDAAWTLAPMGHGVAVIGRDDQTLRWAVVDLQGRIQQPDAELVIAAPTMGPQNLNRLVFVLALATAMIILFTVYQRDAGVSRLALPAGVVLASPGRRATAAGLDLIPCVVIALAIYRIGVDDLLPAWPGFGETPGDMAPGLVIIGLFVLYTLVSEILSARTGGKMLLGLRVTTLDGARPRWWQIVLRCLLKTLDLVAFPVLPLLMLLAPYRQRLGDMVARTVVVTDEPERTAAPRPDDDEY